MGETSGKKDYSDRLRMCVHMRIAFHHTRTSSRVESRFFNLMIFFFAFALRLFVRLQRRIFLFFNRHNKDVFFFSVQGRNIFCRLRSIHEKTRFSSAWVFGPGKTQLKDSYKMVAMQRTMPMSAMKRTSHVGHISRRCVCVSHSNAIFNVSCHRNFFFFVCLKASKKKLLNRTPRKHTNFIPETQKHQNELRTSSWCWWRFLTVKVQWNNKS